MRMLIILSLSCASVFGADAALRAGTSTKTNAATTRMPAKLVLRPEGQTNLVCRTNSTVVIQSIKPGIERADRINREQQERRRGESERLVRERLRR